MDRISLTGTWQLAHCPDGHGELARLDELQWIDARVPGEVHWDLMRAGLIPDPFFDLNHVAVRYLEEHEFWYRRRFSVPGQMAGEKIELIFEGLDCFATVWVNGRLVGTSANALVPQVFDVTEAVRPGEHNEVVVRLSSPLRAVEGRDTQGCAAAFGTVERLWARKSDQCYGWDIAPRLVTAGIWRPVWLVAYSRAALRDFFVKAVELSPDGRQVRVAFEADVEALSAAEAGLVVEAHGSCRESEFFVSAPVRGGRAAAEVVVTQPRLWWTWDLGEPNLYDVQVVLREGPHEIGRRAARIGLRVVRLVQEPEGARERSFVFELNGRRFFARGLNWTPCDAIYPRAEPWKQRRLVRFARHLNCNMLRVWGGGIYEPDEFYAECDAQGIAVFHDFMYACAIYPQAPDFLEMAREEAEAAVRRLRNHACIVLWCGDNENDVAYRHWFGGGRDPWRENKITRQVLPEVVQRLDGTRPYIPSSPFSPDPAVDPQDPLQGDQHIWHHGTAFVAPEYLASEARFPSEIGHLSCPDLQTVVDMLAEKHRWPPNNRAWDEHFGSHYDLDFHPRRRERLDEALGAWLGEVPDDLPTYVLASQLLQGEAYRTWAEYWRLRKKGWKSGGILLWNLADCWPQFSDAIVDFWLRPKLACNFVRLAFEPVHICFSPPTASDAAVFVINDTPRPVQGQWQVWVEASDGSKLVEASGHVSVAAGEVARAADVSELAAVATRRRAVLWAEFRVGERVVSRNFRLPWRLAAADLPLLVRLIPPLGTAP